MTHPIATLRAAAVTASAALDAYCARMHLAADGAAAEATADALLAASRTADRALLAATEKSAAVAAARKAVADADRAIERFALATSRPHRMPHPNDEARGAELLAACAAADATLRAALAL